MITTGRPPRTRRLLIAAFVLSLLVHLFGGSLWAHGSRLVAGIMHRLPEEHQREQQVATADVIHLERRTVPRPAQASRAQPALRPRTRPVERAARGVPVPKARPLPPLRTKPTPSAAPEIAHRVARAPAAALRRQPLGAHGAALTGQQIAQLDAQFAHTIAASHVDLATIQKKSEERPVATRPMPMQFAGLQATLQRGEGYITPTTLGQRIGGTMWYYTHYTYMWPDGHLEDDDIPWPFHYPVSRDLFALHIHLIPLQLPPAGFRVTRPLKPFLAHFLQTRGQG